MIDDQVRRRIVLQLHTQAHYYHMSAVSLKIRAQAQAQIWDNTRIEVSMRVQQAFRELHDDN